MAMSTLRRGITGAASGAAIAVLVAACQCSEALAVCDHANSTFPANGIYVVGSNGSTVDPLGEFSVTLRDRNNNPIPPPATVSIDFAFCTDIRLAPQTFGSITVSGCVVTAPVNDLGVARFRIRGGAVNSGGSPGAGFECAVITNSTVDCSYLNNVTVAAFDQTGNLNGVTGGDLAAWTADFFAAPQPVVGRSDYNFDDAITGGDLAIWVRAFFAGGSAQNGGVAASCP